MTSPDELAQRLRVEALIWHRARVAAVFGGAPMPPSWLVREVLDDAFRAPEWRVSVRPERWAAP